MGARLTPKEFAGRLGKSLGFVMRLINAGEVLVEDVRAPGSKLPRYEIDEGQVNAWRSSRRRRLSPEPPAGKGGRRRVPRAVAAEVIR